MNDTYDGMNVTVTHLT